jgi:hypothetical protein
MKAEGEKPYLPISIFCVSVGGVGNIEHMLWGASDIGSPVPMVKGNGAFSSSSSPLASPRQRHHAGGLRRGQKQNRIWGRGALGGLLPRESVTPGNERLW